MDWIDTHCHLDAPEFARDVDVVRQRARAAGVAHCVIPAVSADHFADTQALAHRLGDSYALGIHPLWVDRAAPDALEQLTRMLSDHAEDPHLVAVGEIGLDGWAPGLDPERQAYFFERQLQIARQLGLPVILHVRRSADWLLKYLRAIPAAPGLACRGIAHAFNGSLQQAHMFMDLGFKLGFGGALSYDRALQLRRLVKSVPLEALVLETDAPDMPPAWRYVTAVQRAQGVAQGRNEPSDLPRIAALVAELRGETLELLAQASWDNACTALPKLVRLRAGRDA